MKKLSDKKLKKVNGGSTVITVRSQTFRNQGSGSHTISTKNGFGRFSSNGRSMR